MLRFKAILSRLLLAALLLCAVAAVSMPFQGCSRNEASSTARAPSFTGKVLSRADVVARCGAAGVPVPYLNSLTYAEVSYAWLSGFQSRFQGHLFGDGVVVNLPTGKTGWDQTFDCVYLAEGFAYYAATEYHADARLTFNAAPGLALVQVDYRPEDAVENHTLFLVLTERGAVWWDPQVGQVTLLPIEVKSIFRSEG